MGPQLAVVAQDRTGAIRQKRFRQRRKLQKAEAVTPVRAVTPLRSRRSILPVILLCTAFAVASVSAGFSIVGLTAIFAAIRRASSWLSSLADERRLVHTNTPSVPGHRETNDTGLGATSKVDNHNGAWVAR
jgi:hypothetical protein